MPQRRFTLFDKAVYALLACNDSDVILLMRTIERIALETAMEHTLAGVDSHGRPIYVYGVREFAIFYSQMGRDGSLCIVDIRNV